jgi:hypothetical protein
MTIRNVLICCALAFAPACSSKSPDAMMDKMLDMMEDLGKVVDSSGGDCNKMATGVEDVVKKYEGDIKDMKAAAEKMKGDKEKSEEMMKKYGPRMQKVMPAMMGMMKCAEDPKFKAVSEKLKGMM